MSSEADDRRRDLRAAVSIMGSVEGEEGELPMVLLNLSASGAMIQVHEEPRPDATYTLRFHVHREAYELRLHVIHFLQMGDAFGWRGPFVEVSAEQAEALQRAVHASAGLTDGEFRVWADVAADAQQEPGAKILVGSTPAGRDIRVLGTDVLEMGADGLELYARLMCELETI